MVKKARSPIAWMNRKRAFFLIVILAVLMNAILLTIRFTITGGYEGLFLLRGQRGALFELKDDLYLGEGNRYIIGFNFVRTKQFLYRVFKAKTLKEPYLYFEWNENRGDGYIRNYLGDGKQLLTCFSRFIDETGGTPEGLFVGGGLPASVIDDSSVKMNETGMAYYDGKRWFHIWCNVNEILFNSEGQPLLPSGWKYLGSRILHHEEKEIVLESSHEVMIGDIPLRIDRHAYFRAGDPYFVLSISMTNTGNRPATYIYLYGDEPWLGNYGTSGGNIGWSAEGLYNFANPVNTSKTNYAGLFDYGNDAIGEGHHFTMTANFIEWFGKVEPYVYFSNGPYDADSSLSSNKRIPLAGDARFIAVQWGPRTLQPGTSEIYTMAIGMAGLNGLPVKPRVNLNYYP
jgi:hypothetical protein